MDLRTYIQQQHGAVRVVIDHQLLSAMTPEQLRARPERGGNSVAWIAWHATRCEDLAVNAIVRGEPQVLDGDGWRERTGLGDGRIGTGLADDEVASFSESVDVAALLAYRKAVLDETQRWLATLDPAALDAVPDLDARLAPAGTLWPEAGAWVPDLWRGWPASVFVNWLAIGHTLVHAGEMQSVMSALGIAGR